MAAPQCMSQDGRQAVFVGTMLETGDGVALCDECLVPWAAAVLSAMTGIDPTPFLQAVSADVDPGDPAVAGRGQEPPPVAPADSDEDAGWASSRVLASEAAEEAQDGPEAPSPAGGRTPAKRVSGRARTGGRPAETTSHD